MNKKTIGLFTGLSFGILAMSALANAGPGDKGFDRLDTDGDGEISAAEVDAAEAKRAEKKSERDAKRAERFAEADADGNGSVSREEMKAYRDAKRAERNPDKNNDGVVDRSEFLDQAEKRFDKQDANGDGVLSDDERRKGNGRRKGGHR